MTIAIIDDHASVREHLSRFIIHHGFTVLFTAASGDDCIRMLEEEHLLPDLCILDVQMPGLDGFETARHIKAVSPEVRIIFFSANQDMLTLARARECGGDAFLSKYCVPEDILQTIQSIGPRFKN